VSTRPAVYFFSPKIVHYISVVVAVRTGSLVIFENLVSNIALDLFEGGFKLFNVSMTSVNLLLGNEPSNRI